MKAHQNLLQISTLLLSISPLAAAWPWPRWLPDLDALVVRADSSSSSSSPSSTASPASSTKSPSTTSAAHTAQETTLTYTTHGSTMTTVYTIDATPSSGSGTTSTTGKASSSKNATATHTTFNAEDPAGSVVMMTPATSLGEQYFKIGDYVTFGWNYTNLQATPTAVDVFATCTDTKQLYTIALNQTVGTTNAVTWDTNSYQQTAVNNPLLTDTYTLVIYDAASSISATAEAGYLAVFDSYTFGMYLRQSYTPAPEWQCVTCSGAMSDMEKRALGFVFGMGVITFLSFTWFVTGFGIIL